MLALVALFASAALVSCSTEEDTTGSDQSQNEDSNNDSDDDSNDDSSDDTVVVSEIIADIVGGSNAYGEIANGVTVTLEANTSYNLDGALHILDGGKLVIESGVTITSQYDDVNTDYIFVEQGGTIEAVGTASAPIVMTSNYTEPGAWGGIHICGYAPINTGIPSVSEIATKNYGGSDAQDNSGTLKYLRVEYTGYSYSEDQECNGISFYGVGRGTTVEYVESYRGSDDGFEFFGGTVDIKYCISTSNSDDSFDWTDGWVGRGQFLVAYQEPTSSGAPICDCLMECDNNGTTETLTPCSRPVLSNLTLISDNDASKEEGVRLRAGTQVEIYNALIGGKTYGLRIDSENTATALEEGNSTLAGIAIESESFKNTFDGSTFTLSQFLAGDTNSDSFVREDVLSDIYVGVIATGVTVPVSDDSAAAFAFDSSATYIGAVEASNDWTAGWSRLSTLK